jgi:histidine triad (HIT) family protein
MADCLFCRIVARQIPARLIEEGAAWIAFDDVNPQAPTHVLVIPRRHVASAGEAAPGDQALLGELLRATALVAAKKRLGNGYRVVINTGPDAGQTVPHLHLHVLGGRALGWPPG